MDDLDHKIVQLLSENARMPVKDIAQKVSLTSPAVSSRIHRLDVQSNGRTCYFLIKCYRYGCSTRCHVIIKCYTIIKTCQLLCCTCYSNFTSC